MLVLVVFRTCLNNSSASKAHPTSEKKIKKDPSKIGENVKKT